MKYLTKIVIVILILIFLCHQYLSQNKLTIPSFNKIYKSNTTVDIPKPTNVSLKLSKGNIKPLDQYEMKNNDPINYIRNLNQNTDKQYLDHDIISPNPIGSTELRFVNEDNMNAWSQDEVSQHPKYYTKNFGNELTKVDEFFKFNQFHDKTSPYSENHLPDRCQYDDNGDVICDFNNKLTNIPPKLITSDNQLINNIGNENIYKNKVSTEILNISGNNYQSWDYNDEKIMNGGNFGNLVGNTTMESNELNLDDFKIDNNYSI